MIEDVTTMIPDPTRLIIDPSYLIHDHPALSQTFQFLEIEISQQITCIQMTIYLAQKQHHKLSRNMEAER